MSSSDLSRALLIKHLLKDLMIMLSRMAFCAADTHHPTSEGGSSKGADYLLTPYLLHGAESFLSS